MRVDLVDLDAVLAAQYLFVGLFDAALADVVAGAVAGVAFELRGVDFAYVAQQVAADLARIAADGAVDGVEPRKVVFVEAQFHFAGNEIGHHVGDTGAHAGVAQRAFEFGTGDSQQVEHLQRVESFARQFAVDDHQVVAGAVLSQVLAVAVEDLAARWVLDDVPQRVAARQFFVFRVDELDVGQPQDDDAEDQQHHRLQRAHPHVSFAGVGHMRGESREVNTCAISQQKKTPTAALTPSRSSVSSACDHESASV